MSPSGLAAAGGLPQQAHSLQGTACATAPTEVLGVTECLVLSLC